MVLYYCPSIYHFCCYNFVTAEEVAPNEVAEGGTNGIYYDVGDDDPDTHRE